MDKDKLKFVNEYLNEKPEILKKGGKWNKILGFIGFAAKGYMRYLEIKGKK